jgi:uncharacterized protein
MSSTTRSDQLAVIHVEGMHCHSCEKSIQRAVSQIEGVQEVEVDFNSGLASVLLDSSIANVRQIIQAIQSAGYQTGNFSTQQANPIGQS